MSAAKVARPYAKAAFEYAVEHNAVNTWSTLLQKAAILVSDEALRQLLINPNLTWQQAAKLMINLCQDTLPNGGENFLTLLAQKKRLLVLAEINAIFINYVASQLQSIDVEIVSAQPLTGAQEEKLRQALTTHFRKTVKINKRIDEDLLGGVVIRADDIVIDDSVRGRLKQLYKKLLLVG